MTQHRDETGAPCTRHAQITEQRLYELATLGSRIPWFHHDAASKMQSLFMALDEISELATDGDQRAPIDTAHAALRSLNQMLATNRAFAKAQQHARISVVELTQRAAESIGVRTRGEMPVHEVRVAVPQLRHALSLVIDLAAGPPHLGRVVDVAVTSDSVRVELTISGPSEAAGKLPPSTAAEAMAIAAFLIGRENGELRCSPNGFVVRVPHAPAPAVVVPAADL